MKTGFVLSGGGIKGVAHLGAIKALEEVGIKPEILAGTSSGSIVGALISNGLSPNEILEIIKSVTLRNLLTPAFSRTGVLKMSKLESLLKQFLPHDSFEELLIPLTVVATNINTGEATYFSKGTLISPILASCAVPFVFQPVEFEKNTYVDGGVLSNLPVEAIRDSCEYLVAINVVSTEMPADTNYIRKCLYLAINQTSKLKYPQCQLIIEPKVGAFVGYELHKVDEIFDLGYKAAQQSFKDSNL